MHHYEIIKVKETDLESKIRHSKFLHISNTIHEFPHISIPQNLVIIIRRSYLIDLTCTCNNVEYNLNYTTEVNFWVVLGHEISIVKVKQVWSIKRKALWNWLSFNGDIYS